MDADKSGPSLQQYVETRFNLLDERLATLTGTLTDTTDAAIAAADVRYQQRFEAQSDALAAAFLSQQTAMQTAFVVAEKAVQAALAAADRAVSKAELAADKRFESVNEFRKTLDDQQRTLMPRSEVSVTVQRLEEKLNSVQKIIDSQIDQRKGITGGWGYAVGVIGLLLMLWNWIQSNGGGGTP